jgi:hypothetical protein
MVDTNKKLPEHGWDNEEIVPKYGTTYGHQDNLGSHKFVYANPDEPDKYSYQKFEASGSYETLQKDKNKNEIRTNLNTGEMRGYTCGGSSSQTDGHKDTNVESTCRENSTGDKGVSSKGSYETATSSKYSSISGSYYTFTVGPRSESKTFNGTDGDVAEEFSGHRHCAYVKDNVQAVKGNKLTMIEEGDYAIHTNKGSFDLQVSSGQLHLMTAADDLIANSNVKILLQVGSQSKVTIEPSKVRLEVGGGSYIEITAGEIKMVSPEIHLN